MEGVIMKTKADEFSQDLVIVALLYILIFALVYLLNSQYQLEKQKVETLIAQKVAVELHQEKQVVEEKLERAYAGLDSLNVELDKYEKAETTIQKVIKELP